LIKKRKETLVRERLERNNKVEEGEICPDEYYTIEVRLKQPNKQTKNLPHTCAQRARATRVYNDKDDDAEG